MTALAGRLPLASFIKIADSILGWLLVAGVVLEDLDAAPAPVDAVTLNGPVGDLHHLDEVQLLSVGGVARALEDQWCGRL